MNKQEPPAKRRGRPKGSLNRRSIFAREWAEKLGLQDPAEFLTKVLNADTVEVTKADAHGNAVLDAEGKPVKQLVVVPLDTRILCARELMGYVYPKLQAQAIQAEVSAVVENDIDITALIGDPEMARHAQALALKLAEQDGARYRADRGLPEPHLIDSPHYD